VTGYRNLGGHLMFLSADQFSRQVRRSGDTVTRLHPWRELGRPEAGLIGVGLYRNDRGSRIGLWKVTDGRRWPWMFRGMSLLPGGRFGSGGIEIDHVAAGSPRGVTVVAEIQDLIGVGGTAAAAAREPLGPSRHRDMSDAGCAQGIADGARSRL
jgi:hypothetical protein